MAKVPEHNLCVYCGSGSGKNPAYMAAARALGMALANAGMGLVYGGGSLGLMGEVAKTVLEAGGYVTGIIPSFLGTKERMLTGVVLASLLLQAPRPAVVQLSWLAGGWELTRGPRDVAVGVFEREDEVGLRRELTLLTAVQIFP